MRPLYLLKQADSLFFLSLSLSLFPSDSYPNEQTHLPTNTKDVRLFKAFLRWIVWAKKFGDSLVGSGKASHKKANQPHLPHFPLCPYFPHFLRFCCAESPQTLLFLGRKDLPHRLHFPHIGFEPLISLTLRAIEALL